MRYLVDVGRLITVEEKSAAAAAVAAVIARLTEPENSVSALPPVIFVHSLATGEIEPFRFFAPPGWAPRRCAAPRAPAGEA